jgi:preprotein translocase subunit YajC
VKSKKFLIPVSVMGLLLAILSIGGCTTPAATGATPSQNDNVVPLVILIVVAIAVFYFLLIRPQQQREKRRTKVLDTLQKGDTVLTAGGIYGQIESIDEDSFVLKIESGATIRVVKGGVLNKIEKI